MPNKLIHWNIATQTGNLARSVPANQLIKDVKKVEVRRQGKSSCTRRPLEYGNFEKLVKMIRGNRDPLKKYGFTALVNLHFHFLARADDTTCALMIDEIKSHSIH